MRCQPSSVSISLSSFFPRRRRVMNFTPAAFSADSFGYVVSRESNTSVGMTPRRTVRQNDKNAIT